MIPLIFWAILIVAVVFIFMIIKTKHWRHKFMWVLIIFAVILLFSGYIFSISGKNIDWNSSEGIQTAVKLYLAWFANGIDNVKSLTGQAIKMDWRGNDTLTIKK